MSLTYKLFKPKYDIPNLWISKINGGGIHLYTNNNTNEYTRVNIKPYEIPEKIFINKNSYYKFIHLQDFIINQPDTIIQMFYMWIMDLQNHILHLENMIQENIIQENIIQNKM